MPDSNGIFRKPDFDLSSIVQYTGLEVQFPPLTLYADFRIFNVYAVKESKKAIGLSFSA